MTDGKRKRSNRDGRHSTRGDAPSKPTPMELIRFCKEVGIDLFGADLRSRIARIESEGNYSAMVNERAAAKPTDSLEEKLRFALSLWTDVMPVAQRVMDETRAPVDLSKDARLEFRWRTLKGHTVPRSVKDEAELLWEHAFAKYEANLLWDVDSERKRGTIRTPAEAFSKQAGAPRVKQRQITGEEAVCVAAAFKKKRKLRAAPDIKTERGMRAAFQAFGCPKQLARRLTEPAVKQLVSLGDKWGKWQNRDRSAKRRASKSQRKKSA